jgi:hypothetical protein
VRKGSKVNLKIEGRTQKAPVLRLGYDPSRKDQYGFDELGLVVRMPDGAERLLPVPAQPLAKQVGWLQGYVPGCVGWHDPRTFIGERRAGAD